MKFGIILVGAAALTAGPACAQATNSVGNDAVKDSTPRVAASATEGANSFTEGQARKRFAKAGYRVSSLVKDDAGVWVGTATKSGKPVKVGLDFKGNVARR